MIHSLWHSFMPRKIWISGIVLVVLLLTAVKCVGNSPEPPEILGFKFDPPDKCVLANDTVTIEVAYVTNGHKIEKFRWEAEEGEIKGNGKHMITYLAPATTGSYTISVQLQYPGGTVEDSTEVEVVSQVVSRGAPTPDETTKPPTETPTHTPTFTPADTPTTTSEFTPTETPTIIPTPTDTPSPTHTLLPTATFTPIPTPTPTLLPPPAPIYPLGEENSVNIERQTNTVNLKWQWDYSLDKVGGGTLFSVRIHQVGSSDDCVHIQLRENVISEHRMTCPSGRYYWQIVVTVPLVSTPVKPSDWRNISLPSEPQYFDFVLQPDNDDGPPPCNPPWC
jgi:hypothetical protein